jgi:hypothetical protein
MLATHIDKSFSEDSPSPKLSENECSFSVRNSGVYILSTVEDFPLSLQFIPDVDNISW